MAHARRNVMNRDDSKRNGGFRRRFVDRDRGYGVGGVLVPFCWFASVPVVVPVPVPVVSVPVVPVVVPVVSVPVAVPVVPVVPVMSVPVAGVDMSADVLAPVVSVAGIVPVVSAAGVAVSAPVVADWSAVWSRLQAVRASSVTAIARVFFIVVSRS
jgi:hypothetical protein